MSSTGATGIDRLSLTEDNPGTGRVEWPGSGGIIMRRLGMIVAVGVLVDVCAAPS